jgi:hypothetical protein
MSDDMNITTRKNTDYRLFKTANSRQPLFIDMTDENSVKMARSQHNNENLHISVCSYNTPDPSAPRTYPLYFKIASNSSENVLKAALEICFYSSDNFSIPQDCIEVIYTGGGNGMDAGAAGSAANSGGKSGNNTGNANRIAAEIVILIPPIVFARQSTPLMLAINYELARQLAEEVTENTDFDIYHRDYLIRLPNSFNSQTGSYVITLHIKELLYMDAAAIAGLSKESRPEDSLILPRPVPEAIEWFAGLLEDTERKQQRQKQLQELLLKNGWQIPPCIRRLTWADLGKEEAVEACRIISQFYSWIDASPNEIRYHLQQIDRRNRIEDYPRLKAIIAFALENPGFAGCEHPMTQYLCPTGKCFMAELIEKYEKPYLF